MIAARGWRALPLLVCLAFGALISALPHLLSWARIGQPVWIADLDELELYLASACQAYHDGALSFADPVFADRRPIMYPWLQLFPGAALARIFGLGPEGIGLMWRLQGGLMVSLGWYLALGVFLRQAWLRSLLSMFLCAAAGLLEAKVFVKGLQMAYGLAITGQTTLLQHQPLLMTHWRILSPSLSLFYLLLHIWALGRARQEPSVRRIAVSAAVFGLLFHVYFYYWTTVALGLGLAFLMDREGRRVYWRVGALGALLGLPFLANSWWIKASYSPDWSHRIDFFVPIARSSEWLIPKIGPALLLATLAAVLKRWKDMRLLWAHAAAGLLLLNHQVLTGLQISNAHWFYAWGPLVSLLVILCLARELESRWPPPKTLQALGAAALALHAGIGFWLRAVEATRTRSTAEILESYQRYSTQKEKRRSLLADSVIAGDPAFVRLAVLLDDLRPLDGYAVAISMSIDNDEWAWRQALNAWLTGRRTPEEFAQERKRSMLPENPWAREVSFVTGYARQAGDVYKQISSNPAAALKRFGVRYLALPPGGSPPQARGLSWKTLQQGPFWGIFELTP